MQSFPSENIRYKAERIAALTDSVVATGLTLFAFNIQGFEIPSTWSMENMVIFFHHVQKELFTFLACFFSIGWSWFAHHIIFSSVKFVDRRVMRLNLTYLLLLVLVPFLLEFMGVNPSNLLAELFFSLNYLASLVVLTMIWAHIYKHPENSDIPVSEETYREVRLDISMLILTSLCAVTMAFFIPGSSVFVWMIFPFIKIKVRPIFHKMPHIDLAGLLCLEKEAYMLIKEKISPSI
jgi:uncharacterized membrane protein